MANANINFNVTGTDKTGAAFNSVKWKAKATGLSIKNALGGALAFAGAYFGFRAIKGGIDELGKLDDISQKTSTGVDELTRAVEAFEILGIQNMGIDNLAKSFAYMEKNTGRVGLSGFYETIEEIGKIEDPAKRSQEAMRIFGRSGMEFIPLINAAKDGTAALRGVLEAMSGISAHAAKTGDDLNDAEVIIIKEFHSLWLQGIAAVGKLFTDNMPSSARQGAAVAAAYMEYWAKNIVDIAKSAWNRIKGFGAAVGATVGNFIGTLAGGGSFADAFDAVENGWSQSMEEMDADLEEFEKKFEARAERLAKRLEAAFNLQRNYQGAALSTGDRTKLDFGLSGYSAHKPQIRNELILGGSNASNKLATFGPTLQSEQKKTNALLERVVKNTERTADNTEEAAQTETPGVMD